MAPPWRAVIAGHSYIKRLKHEVEEGRFPDNFGLQEYQTIRYMYRSGAHTCHLSQDIEVITAHTPEVVILQIGGNDFSGAEKQDHLEVANNIISWHLRSDHIHRSRLYTLGNSFIAKPTGGIYQLELMFSDTTKKWTMSMIASRVLHIPCCHGTYMSGTIKADNRCRMRFCYRTGHI